MDEFTEAVYWWARNIVDNIPYPKFPFILDVKDKILADLQNEREEAPNETVKFNEHRIEEEGQSVDGTTDCKSQNDEPNVDQSSNKPKENKRNTTRKRTGKDSDKAWEAH